MDASKASNDLPRTAGGQHSAPATDTPTGYAPLPPDASLGAILIQAAREVYADARRAGRSMWAGQVAVGKWYSSLLREYRDEVAGELATLGYGYAESGHQTAKRNLEELVAADDWAMMVGEAVEVDVKRAAKRASADVATAAAAAGRLEEIKVAMAERDALQAAGLPGVDLPVAKPCNPVEGERVQHASSTGAAAWVAPGAGDENLSPAGKEIVGALREALEAVRGGVQANPPTVHQWKTGDQISLICESCGEWVEATMKHRDHQPLPTDPVIPNLLVTVCSVCDQTVAIPAQSMAAIQALRAKVKAGAVPQKGTPQDDEVQDDGNPYAIPGAALPVLTDAERFALEVQGDDTIDALAKEDTKFWTEAMDIYDAMTKEDEKFWTEVVIPYELHRAEWPEPTVAELQAELDAIEAEPLPQGRIDEMVAYALARHGIKPVSGGSPDHDGDMLTAAKARCRISANAPQSPGWHVYADHQRVKFAVLVAEQDGRLVARPCDRANFQEVESWYWFPTWLGPINPSLVGEGNYTRRLPGNDPAPAYDEVVAALRNTCRSLALMVKMEGWRLDRPAPDDDPQALDECRDCNGMMRDEVAEITKLLARVDASTPQGR